MYNFKEVLKGAQADARASYQEQVPQCDMASEKELRQDLLVEKFRNKNK